jgi:hypothetical protein
MNCRFNRLWHGSGGWLLTSHQDQTMSNLQCTKWHWDRYSPSPLFSTNALPFTITVVLLISGRQASNLASFKKCNTLRNNGKQWTEMYSHFHHPHPFFISFFSHLCLFQALVYCPANTKMFPKFQVATVCYSGRPPARFQKHSVSCSKDDQNSTASLSSHCVSPLQYIHFHASVTRMSDLSFVSFK